MRFALLTLVVLALPAGMVHADTFACRGGRIIETGMTIAEVGEKCGPPTSSEVRNVEVRARNANGYVSKMGTVRVDLWRYDRGTRRQAAVIEFREGKVYSIEFHEDR